MENLLSFFGKSAGLLALAAFIPYVVAILQGKTKPNIITWSIWSIVNLITLKSYNDSGAVNTLWMPAAFLTGDVIVLVLALRSKKILKPSIIEYICILLAGVNILTIVLFSYNPDVVLWLSVGTMFIGGLPTIQKAWLRPDEENKTAWIMFGFAALLNLASIEDWSSFEVVLHPMYVVSIDVTMAVILLWRK